MKHLFKLGIFVCLLTFYGGALWAQGTLFSQLARHNNITGNGVITRVVPFDWVLTCSKSTNGDRKHTFSFYSTSTGATKYFTCNLGTLFSSSQHDYYIKDMYIFQHKCYFCGYRNEVYEPMYGPDGSIISPGGILSQGFVGYFKFFPTTTGNSGSIIIPENPFSPPEFPFPTVDSIYLIDIPYTDSITQIVAHHDSPEVYDVFLMAVASTSLLPKSTSIVELTKPVGTADTYWMLNIVQPTCTESDEYLTDIVLTENFVVVASKLPYGDGELDGDTDPTHYLFRLHEAKRTGFYHTNLPPISPPIVYEYDVSSYGEKIGCHHIGDPIRLCPMDGDQFCVYYNYARRTPEISNGVGSTVLFWMNGANQMDHAARIRELVFSHTKEAVWIGDPYKTIAVLMSDRDFFPNGAVIFPTLNPTSYGPCLTQMIQGVDIHSIDCHPTTHNLYLGGTDAVKKLWHGFQDETNYCDYPFLSCFYTWDECTIMLDKKNNTMGDCLWNAEIKERPTYAKRSIVELSTYDAEIMCTHTIGQ